MVTMMKRKRAKAPYHVWMFLFVATIFCCTVGWLAFASQKSLPHSPSFIPDALSKEEVLEYSKKPVGSTKKNKSSPSYGRLNHALYRLDGKLLGPSYIKAIEAYDRWLEGMMDEKGARFAAQQTARPEVRHHHQACYEAPFSGDQDDSEYLELERQKKSIPSKMETDTDEEALSLYQKLFYGDHKQSLRTIKKRFLHHGKKWAWHAAGMFSTQWSCCQRDFRSYINGYFEDFREGLYGGKPTGTFWYPPGAIREWHTNNFDINTAMSSLKPWRMYYVRQKAATPDGLVDTEATELPKNCSALHLIESERAPAERLTELGGEKIREYPPDDGRPNVWRLPDQNGYVTIFRLTEAKPSMWHCIVADCVHRFSLGMSLSDRDVEILLKRAGVPY